MTRVTDGSLQGGDATDEGGGSKVGVVVQDADVVVGLGRRGQMSRWIWHPTRKWGAEAREGKRGQRSVRRRLIWNGRGRVEFELSNDERAGPSSVRSGWSRRSSTAKTGGLGLPEHCAGARLGGGGARCGWAGPETGFLEGWRFADSPVRASEGRESGGSRGPFLGGGVVLILGGPGQSSGGPGSLCWNCRWFLWFCGGSTGRKKHCQECRRAGKQCPASPWAGGDGVGSNALGLWGKADEELGKLCGGLCMYLWLPLCPRQED